MAMHRDDLRRNTWSTTASQQSHTSTRVNDGHTPVPDTITTSSSKLAPPTMMSRPSAPMKSSAQDSISTPLISRRDPIFNTDSLTRYPPPKPSLVSGSSTSPASGSSQEKRPYVIPAQRSRRNSTASSSAHSSILHTIHEEDSADPRPAPGLQRSQSSIQPRAMLQAKIQVGQVYPKDLQPSMPMVQRSVSQFTPSHRPPPAYTEDPQPSRTPSSEHRRRERKQASADQQRQAYPMPGPHPAYVEDPQVTRAPSSDRRRREREQAQMDQQQQRYPIPEPQPLEIQVTNAVYDPRFPSQDREKHERPQSRSSRGTHSSSSSRSGHSSSSTPQTTPDQDPRGGMPPDPRAQYPAYPFRDVREMEENRALSRQPSMGPQLSAESERRYMSDDRRALRAVNALSGVPEIDEGRSGHRQSYHQPYPERYPQGHPKQHAHLYPEIQDDRPYPGPRQGHQQTTEQYPRHQPQPYPQAEPLDGGIRKASTHAAEPSWKSEDRARPAGDPALLQPYTQQQYPIQDNASSKPRSMNSSLTTSSVMPRYNPHLPKKLVMPAPLQAKSERVFNEVFDQPRPTPTPRKRRDKPSGTAMPRPGVQGTPSRTREPTPSLVPPLLGNGYEVDSSVSAGRKLKKRSSYVPPPPPAMSRLSPTKALNFAQPTTSAPSASEKATSHPVKSAPDKATKKVLSKRRTKV
ncbi:hypothetical protein FA13DRAFT_419145 [Coprinellus micaceus]|uniref:Uncharacterized protein n=1 Tax=Coprinellus micaceus TaxID=71717 RepID=A0A4Y7TXP2_COPMI|nr:hypothetical protein FA13DRAFT_419145 [Coprinellus micaceus]